VTLAVVAYVTQVVPEVNPSSDRAICAAPAAARFAVLTATFVTCAANAAEPPVGADAASAMDCETICETLPAASRNCA